MKYIGTIFIIYVLSVNSLAFSQKINKVSKPKINCLLQNFELFYIQKNIDSLINSSKKDYSKFISTYFYNKDTIFITNKTTIDDSLVVNYIKKYYIEVYHIPMLNKIISLKENKDNVTVYGNKKNKFFFKIYVQSKLNYNYCIIPIKDGLIVYVYQKLNFIKYFYKKQKLNKIRLSNFDGDLSLFFDKNLNLKKIFFTNTEYLSCFSEYKRIFYNGRILKIK